MSTFKQDLINQLKKKEIQAIPELVAFNIMMALIPMLIIFFQILAFLSIETTLFDETIAQYLPAELYQFIMEFLETASINFSAHPLLVAVTLVTLTLTISKGVNGIFKAFLITYDCAGTSDYKNRLAAILAFFLLLGFGAFATAFITTSHILLADLPTVTKTVIEIGIFALVCFIFFLLLFKLAPNKNKRVKAILPGTVLASVGFILTTTVFTYYVDRLANFHLIYGTLSVIIILLMWLYLLGWVINIGIQVNYVHEKSHTRVA
ncbi:MAG: YihY/virulence factor BrkB family protein [Turicibacter sp.]|nr:YihY/virulence factor BrkB family protein [Turicibacter sp.]